MPGPNPTWRSLYPAGFTLFPALLSLFRCSQATGFSKTRAQCAEPSLSVSPFERLGHSSSVLLGSPPAPSPLPLPKPWRGSRHSPPLCRLNTLSPPMEHSRSWAFRWAGPPDLALGGTHSWLHTGQDRRWQVSEAGKRSSGDRHRVPFWRSHPCMSLASLEPAGPLPTSAPGKFPRPENRPPRRRCAVKFFRLRGPPRCSGRARAQC
jgi:hypothetical protein